MKLRHILIASLVLLPSMAAAVQYDGITLVAPTTISGLEDGVGAAPGGTSGTVTGAFPLTIDGIGGEYSGFITDGVSLIIQNADQALSGNSNDYSGGTTVGSGGILRLRADAALGSGSLTLQNGGTLVVESIAPFIFGLDAQAGSAIDLTGGNIFLQAGTHTVATSLNGGGGTIFMDNGAILSLQATNALNQVSLNTLGNTVILLNGFDQQLGDPVSGSTFLPSDEIDLDGRTLSITGIVRTEGIFTGGGTIRIAPTGAFQLGGVNPFQDGIIMDIRDNPVGSFSLAGSTVTFTEDNLLSNNNSSISLSSFLSGPGTLILDVSAGEEIQLGQTFDSGNITKDGAGTLRLGTGNYADGDFDINAGTVVLTSGINGSGGATMTIDSGATLTTPGTANITGVTFTNNGTIALDAGTQLTVPNYTGAGTLDFGLTDASGGQLRVASGGTANFLAGSAITADTLAGNYSLGQSYTVVDLLSGATLSGAANIDGNLITTPLVEMQVNATNGLDEDVTLLITQVFGMGATFDCSAVAAADTANRCQVLGALTEAMNNTGDIGSVYDVLQTLGTDDEVRAALDSLSGDLVPQMSTVLFRQNDQFRDISLNRISNIMEKKSVAQVTAPLRLASAGADMQQQLAMLVSNTGALLGEGPEDTLTGGLWAKAIAQRDQAHEDNQLNATHYGLQAGMDGMLDDRWMLGATGAFTTADTDMENRPQDGTTETYQAGVYTAWHSGRFWLSGVLGYGFHQTDYGRDIQVGAVQRHAEGEYDSHSVTGAVEAAYGFYLDSAWALTPAVSLRYTGLWQEGFTETGADEAGLRFDDSYDDNVTGTAALSFSRAYFTDTGNRIIPQLRLGAQYDMGERDLNRDVDFIGLPGVIMDIGPAAFEDRLSGLAGFGLAYIMPSEALALVLDYDGRISADLSSHRVFAGLRVQW